MDEALLRSLTPSVIGILVRRGADFAAAEDAVQDALVEAVRAWPADEPRDPKGWLVTVAWRKFLDATRSEVARRRREDAVHGETRGDDRRQRRVEVARCPARHENGLVGLVGHLEGEVVLVAGAVAGKEASALEPHPVDGKGLELDQAGPVDG